MSHKLNVLFICGWYPSKVLTNNGDFIQRHAEAVSINHKITVVHIVTDKQSENNVEYISKVINGVETHIAYLKHFKNPLKKIYYFLKAFKILIQKAGPIDIVHLNQTFPFGVFSLYLKWFKKIPFIISEHFTGYHYPQSKNISFSQKLISSIITRTASFVCPVSNDLKNSMQKLGLKGNYFRVPNVVNTDLFYPSERSENIFTLTHISNMNNYHKNIEGILRVIKKLENEIDDFRFKIIGENSEMYISFAKKIGLNLKKTIFIDQIPHEEIAENLKESNLFILFSNYENLPCVILEAFSCGIPVISTNVGGIEEYFPDNFGKLIDIKDEEKLKEEILNFYNKKYNIATKEEMHNYVKSLFSEEAIAKAFTNLYHRALNI